MCAAHEETVLIISIYENLNAKQVAGLRIQSY